MTGWAITFVVSTALAAVGFVVVAMLWLRKLRQALNTAFGDTIEQNLKTSQRLNETLAQIQRQQQEQDQRLLTVAESNVQLKHQINQLLNKVETAERDHTTSTSSRMLH